MRPGSEANANDERLWCCAVTREDDGGANEDTSSAGRDSSAKRADRESIANMVGCGRRRNDEARK